MPETLNFKTLLDGIGSNGLQQNYSAGETVAYQESVVKNYAVVVSGRLIIQTYTKDGQVVWITNVNKGQTFGFELFSENPTLQYEIKAETDAQIIYIKPNDFMTGIMKSRQSLEFYLMGISEHFNTITQRLIEAKSLSAIGRICVELKRRGKPIGIDPDKFIIRPTPVFSELALRAGSTRESVSRTVSGLVRKGILIRKTGALVIADMEKLDSKIK